MKYLIFVVAIVLMLYNNCYSQGMNNRNLANQCRQQFDQCYNSIPKWHEVKEVIIVKDVPDKYKYLCGYVTVTKTYPDELYKRYVYRYTGKEAKRKHLTDLSRKSPNKYDVNFEIWKKERDQKRITCKIKEDKCRSKIGFKPRHVDKNLYAGKIFNKNIYGEIE